MKCETSDLMKHRRQDFIRIIRRLGHFRSGPGTKRGGGDSLTGSFSQFCSNVTHSGQHSISSQNYRNTKIRDTQPVSQVARLLFRFALLGQLRSPQTPVSSDLWGCKNSLAGNPPSLWKCNFFCTAKTVIILYVMYVSVTGLGKCSEYESANWPCLALVRLSAVSI